MGGLNPNALPHAPSKQQKVLKESTYDQKKNINIAKPPKCHASVNVKKRRLDILCRLGLNGCYA